jgi:hypothetical protein
MKNIYYTLIVIMLAATPKLLFAQENIATYSKGSSNISASYGFINAWKVLLDSYFTQKSSASGPLILTYEYGATKKISVGLSGGYSKVMNVLGTFTDFLISARANYHLGAYKKFDPYLSVGWGYYWFNYKNDYGIIFPFTIPTPFAISAAAGAKYYFYRKFGAYSEVGYVDGAIIKIGLTYKTK